MQKPKTNTHKRPITHCFLPPLKRRALLSFFITIQVIIGQAQCSAFKNYSIRDGLRTDVVYDKHHDKQGYIWIFSKYRTLKYNGSPFLPVLKNLSTKDAFIFSVYENDYEKKWVANSNAKIHEVRNDSACVIKGFEKISSELKTSVSEITQLITDDSLNIYALANGSSYKFVYTLGNYKVIEISNNLKPDRVFIKILKVKGRYLYIAYCLKNEEFIFHHLNKPVYIQLYDNKRILKLKHTRMIAAFRNFIKTNNDFNFNYSKNLGTLLNGEKPFYIPISSIVLYYTRDKNGHTCVGYLNAGLFALDENDSIINHYLQKLSVNNVIIDFQNVFVMLLKLFSSKNHQFYLVFNF